MTTWSSHSHASDQQWLAVLGDELSNQDTTTEVELGGIAAAAAVAAWHRDESSTDAGKETDLDRSARNAASELALIGLVVERDGVQLANGNVRVLLHPDAVAEAVNAARSAAG